MAYEEKRAQSRSWLMRLVAFDSRRLHYFSLSATATSIDFTWTSYRRCNDAAIPGSHRNWNA